MTMGYHRKASCFGLLSHAHAKRTWTNLNIRKMVLNLAFLYALNFQKHKTTKRKLNENFVLFRKNILSNTNVPKKIKNSYALVFLVHLSL